MRSSEYSPIKQYLYHPDHDGYWNGTNISAFIMINDGVVDEFILQSTRINLSTGEYSRAGRVLCVHHFNAFSTNDRQNYN